MFEDAEEDALYCCFMCVVGTLRLGYSNDIYTSRMYANSVSDVYCLPTFFACHEIGVGAVKCRF